MRVLDKWQPGSKAAEVYAYFKKNGAHATPMKGQKGAENTLIYLLAHKSKEAAAASFNTFRADPDWVKAKEESEKKAGGSLTEDGMAGVKSVFLNPTD